MSIETDIEKNIDLKDFVIPELDSKEKSELDQVRVALINEWNPIKPNTKIGETALKGRSFPNVLIEKGLIKMLGVDPNIAYSWQEIAEMKVSTMLVITKMMLNGGLRAELNTEELLEYISTYKEFMNDPVNKKILDTVKVSGKESALKMFGEVKKYKSKFNTSTLKSGWSKLQAAFGFFTKKANPNSFSETTINFLRKLEWSDSAQLKKLYTDIKLQYKIHVKKNVVLTKGTKPDTKTLTAYLDNLKIILKPLAKKFIEGEKPQEALVKMLDEIKADMLSVPYVFFGATAEDVEKNFDTKFEKLLSESEGDKRAFLEKINWGKVGVLAVIILVIAIIVTNFIFWVSGVLIAVTLVCIFSIKSEFSFTKKMVYITTAIIANWWVVLYYILFHVY